MKIAHLFNLDFRNKLILLIFSLLLVTGCRDWAVDPEVRLGLIVLIAIVSFITIFTKPIIGIYAVAIISTAFSPPINIGFANLYFHQWVILIAVLASISSGLILENFHTKLKSELNAPMMVFVGSLVLSLSHAPHMVIGIKSFLYVGVLIASYYLVLLGVNSVKHIKVFISLLLIATSVVCLISLQYHSSGRLGSLVLRNPNSYGNFLALVISLSLSLFVFGTFERGKKLLIACSLILMFISLVFTFSRSAWFGVLLAILSLCVFKPKATVILLFIGVISTVFLFFPIKTRVFDDISDPGAQYRMIKAKIAYNSFKKHPILGNGLGSFHYKAQFSNIWAYRAHSTLENNYLLMLAEGGIIEFLAFLYLIVALGKKTIVLLRKVKDPFLFSVVLGCSMSIISTLGAGIFEDTLFFPKNNWLTGMFMGMIILVERIHEESLATTNSTGVKAEREVRTLQMEIA